jgi:hypothetical protein
MVSSNFHLTFILFSTEYSLIDFLFTTRLLNSD